MQTTKSVKDPSKQRLRLYNAPAHIRHKLMSAHLAPDLVKSQGVKSIPVRKGDTVRIVRGDHEGFEGKISTVDLKNYRIFLEGLTREKVDGTVIFVAVHPSKVLVKNLNLNDRWRKSTIQRKKPLPGREEAEEKPTREITKPAEVKPKERTKPKEAVEAEEMTSLEPTAKKAKRAETKATTPPTVEAEKKPRAAKKKIEKPTPPETEEKPTSTTKSVKAPSRKKKAKETPPEEKSAKTSETKESKEKTAETRAKKSSPKKTPAKSATKTNKKTGGA
ncbi:MAG TPA: 50S ribosomal protein L24 [Candidatus Sulfotelmatobacter sp.]|nr:50S ribosomal protein L24 [Candidatus Sulfotelmatobacter sp.]